MTVPVDYGDFEWLLERHSQFHKEYRNVEREYLELRIVLRDTESALRGKPEDEDLRLRRYYIRRRLKELEDKFHWLVSGSPPEVAFWAPPSG